MITRTDEVASPQEYYADSMASTPTFTIESFFTYSYMSLFVVLFLAFLGLYFFIIIKIIKAKYKSKDFMTTKLLTASAIYAIFSFLIFEYSISELNFFPTDKDMIYVLFPSMVFSLLLGYGYFILVKMEKIQIIKFLICNKIYEVYSKIIFIGLTGMFVPTIIISSPHAFNIIVAVINVYFCYAYILILKEKSICK